LKENQNRKLSAILFADIVGYTVLIQKDEQTTASLLRHFQKQLEEKVDNHNGRIVNFYGDGALCFFQIPIDAVRCAMALQTTFQDEPRIPVRLGIHSGTVTLEGDKIFGYSDTTANSKPYRLELYNSGLLKH
jgi:class 3 adenylate cyclase